MNTLQKNILDEYVKVFKNPTIREMSEDTGIQMTRVFRLFNGSKMRLNEYVIFKSAIEKERGISSSLSHLLEKSLYTLPREQLKKLEKELERALYLNSIATA